MRVRFIEDKGHKALGAVYTCTPLETIIITDALRFYANLYGKVPNLDRAKAISMLEDVVRERNKYNDR